MKNISIIEAETDFGVNVEGTDKGPAVLLHSINSKNINKIYKIEKQSIKKEYEKDNKEKNLNAVNEFNTRLYKRVQEVLDNGEIPLTIGGDHSMAIASSLASIKKHEKLGIIWFDAHGDFNTFETTETGNIHGLPLAAATGYERKKICEFHKGNFYPYKNTVIVGARDIDKLEWVNLKNAGVTVFSTEDVRKEGVENIVERAIKIATNGTNGIHISFDIDMIDPNEAPGVSIPAKDGITREQAKQMVDEFLKQEDSIKSIDIVEFNPVRDIDKKTENIALDIINKIIK